jgi:osmotically-inducible protein OsmY
MRHLFNLALLAAALSSLTACAPLAITGAGVGVMMAEDRRTAGTYILDEEIEHKISARISEAYPEGAHVNATSYNRRVLLTGEVKDDPAKAKVTELAKGVPNVREVQNETIVGGVSTFLARSNDAYITAKVKTRFLDDRRFNAHHVKVVTEAATVYLMGVVKKEEGAAAAEVAARTSGVSKVVKVFEYLD